MNENYGKANSSQRDSYYDLMAWNTDISVEPHVCVRGMMGKDDGDVWRYIKISSNGCISNDDNAANMRVSAFSDDAAFFRISAIGAETRDGTLIDGLDQTVSAMIVSSRSVDFSMLDLSATPQLAVRPGTEDAVEHRVSAFSNDAELFRVSAIGGANDHILVDGTNNALSAVILADRWTDAYSLCGLSTTRQLMVRCGTLTASEHRVSCFQRDAVSLNVSAKSLDAGTLRTSAIQEDASNLMVSGRSDDAALFRVSSLGSGDASDLRISAIDPDYKQVFAYHATYTTDIEYVGTAVPGTATSAVSAWQIQKLTYLAAGQVSGILWAISSNSFDREWDERIEYTYA